MSLHVLSNTLEDNLRKLEEIIMFVEFEVGDRVFHRRLNQEGTVVQVKSTFCVVKLDDGKEVSPHKVEIAKVRGKDEGKSEQELVSDFHKAFKYSRSDEPVAIPADEVIKRVAFIQEELIELLAASVDTEGEFDKYMDILDEKSREAYSKELPKVQEREEAEALNTLPKMESELAYDKLTRIVEQSDALVDILVFTFGTGDISGVKLKPLFDIVMDCNMSKLDPETGEPIYNEFGKIMKGSAFRKPEPELLEEIQKQLREAEDNA